MKQYRLRHKSHDVEIQLGDYVVGRGDECQLAIDDPLVSRRHARFIATPMSLSVEDLGSRNGVLLNGARIDRRTELADGDVVTISGYELTLAISGHAPRSRENTITRATPKPAMMLSSGVIEKALALGKFDEAERLLTAALRDAWVIAGAPEEAELLAQAARAMLGVAAATGKSVWIDQVFETYHAASSVVPAPIIDELHALARRVRYAASPVLEDYIAGLQSRAERLSPTERFSLKRTEGLLRVLKA